MIAFRIKKDRLSQRVSFTLCLSLITSPHHLFFLELDMMARGEKPIYQHKEENQALDMSQWKGRQSLGTP